MFNNSLNNENIISINGLRIRSINNNQEKEYMGLTAFILSLNSSSPMQPEHVIMHEIVHCQNKNITQKIPKKFKPIVKNIGVYASICFNKKNDEVYAELKTKQLLVGIDDDEQTLLDYLENC